MSNASSFNTVLTRRSCQTDSEIRAIEPPVGIGNGLPTAMRLSTPREAGFFAGARIFTVWPFNSNSRPRLEICDTTPPGYAKSYGETSAIFKSFHLFG